MNNKLLEAIREHSGLDDEQIIEAGEHGADAGWAGFTYDSDCLDFYKKNKKLIEEFVEEESNAYGYGSIPEFLLSFEIKDRFETFDGVKILIVWFCLEQAGRYLEGLNGN